jgi:hypothetical protein
MANAKLPIVAPAGVSLCETCTHATVVKGHTEPQQIVVCGRHFDPVIVPFPVRECSEYALDPVLNLALVKELAWEVHISYNGLGEKHELASGKIDLNKRISDA